MKDLKLARCYLSKAANAKERGIPFELSFRSFHNLKGAKFCYYTRLPLTESTFSIDRIDASKGYISGNVVACHKAFNGIKGNAESGQSVGREELLRGLLKWKKLMPST